MKKFRHFLISFIFLTLLGFLRDDNGAQADVTCKDIVEGNSNFPIPSDGRAITPCQTAYGSCLYVALLEHQIATLEGKAVPSEADQQQKTRLESALSGALNRKSADLMECSLFLDFFSANPDAADKLTTNIQKH